MFESGKKVYFKEKGKAHFATILETVEEDSIGATLKVQSDDDGSIHIIQKVKFINDRVAEKYYREYGHY